MSKFGIAKEKIGGNNLLTIFVAGITKSIEEPLLARVPFVGNGTVLSGVIKLVAGGWLIPKFAGKSDIANGIAIGFGIDGVEDIIRGIFFGGGIMSGGGSANASVI